MIEMNFKSNYIRNFREKYNLSQYELADLMNVNQSTIARWEKGEKTPSHENIAKLNDIILNYKINNDIDENNDLIDKENHIIKKTVDHLLEIAKQHKNPKRKRATTKLALTILDEKLKRG